MAYTLVPGTRGADYAYARPPSSVLLGAGFIYVVRYLSVAPSNPAKNITAAEAAALMAGGISILLVWEISTTTADKGASQGKLDGTNATLKGRVVGYPSDCLIVIAVDSDTTAANVQNRLAYCNAFADACGYGVGVYGDSDIMLAFGNRSQCGWLDAARSHSPTVAQATAAGLIHVKQGLGVVIGNQYTVDPNTTLQPIPSWSYLTDPIVSEGAEVIKVTNAEPRLHTDGNTYPAGVIKYAYGAAGKRHIKTEGESGKLFPGAGIALTNAELDAIPDVGTVTVVVPPAAGQKTHFQGALLGNGVMVGDLS